jgi:predicted alpha/beta-fold hydrolase
MMEVQWVDATSGSEDNAQLRNDLLWYRRQYLMSLIVTIGVSLACAILAAYLVYHKHDPQLVQVPIGAGERAAMLAELQQAHKQLDDLKALTLNYKAQIKKLNAAIADHDGQLEALQARGQEISQYNKEMAQRMGTTQGVVLEAKRVLGPMGLKSIQVVE